MKYLELLAKQYPTSQSVMCEIMNLKTILTLPKGTEFFFSDLHGEYEAFLHLLKSASGVIKNKIDLLYKDSLNDEQRQILARLIYYPKNYLEHLSLTKEEKNQWYEDTISYLITIARFVSTKYTRSKVKKKMPKEYVYILDELLNCHHEYTQNYFYEIIQSIIELDQSEAFIIALCEFIRNICIDYIHILGDIFDRGPRPDYIIDELMKYHCVDIQWGNHDISWMGAACGNEALMANVIRLSLSYNCFDLLEDGYGINLRPLSDFAREVYKDDPCLSFQLHILDENQYDLIDKNLAAKMHKAITIIQLKLEGQLIEKHPEYHMEHLQWLKQIDYQNHTVTYQNNIYQLNDDYFPTIDPLHPLELTLEEKQLMISIQASFQHNQRLHKHIQYLYSHGHMYKIFNDNLLFHGCIPMNEDGQLRYVHMNKKLLCGKSLLDECEKIVNQAYFSSDQNNKDDMWYLWCSKDSPLFGKSKLSVFEKYFVDSELQREKMDPYYQWMEKEETCQMILEHFHLNRNHSHIINGHVPVKQKDGDKPIKGNGKLLMIDGGISKAYQQKTGIAGYTLIYDSRHLQLAQHCPYHEKAKTGLLCLTPHVDIIETRDLLRNRDCDIGKELQQQIDDLFLLLKAYQEGKIKENS